MRSLQDEILELLGSREMDVDELVSQLHRAHSDLSAFDVRSGLLPLLATGQIEFAKSGGIKQARSAALATA